MKFQTPLARARGLGPARVGTAHWWRQRVTSVALAPLCLWLLVAVARWSRTDYEQFVQWVGAPWNSVLLLVFLASGFFHAALGVQVVIEDYVHVEWAKVLAIVLVKLILGLFAAAGIFATLRIVFLG